jgi:hypothetical protein
MIHGVNNNKKTGGVVRECFSYNFGFSIQGVGWIPMLTNLSAEGCVYVLSRVGMAKTERESWGCCLLAHDVVEMYFPRIIYIFMSIYDSVRSRTTLTGSGHEECT